jgi:phage protein D
MGLDILVCVDDIPNENLTQQVSTVEVYEKMDQNTTYKLNFIIDVCDGDIAGPIENDTSPGKTLSILAKANDSLVCLVKGPVTQQQAHIQHGGAGSRLHIEGEDTAHTMDHTSSFQLSDSASDSDIVSTIINRNSQMIADVEATPDSMHNEDNHSHVQRETDLSLIRSLARRNGFHFWITYSEEGLATGHFKPRNLLGEPAAVLIVNHENYTIDSLQISADSRVPSQTEGKQLDLRNKSEIGGTVTLDDTPLGAESLAQVTSANPQSMHLAPTVDDSGAMQARSRAALREAQWFIQATCHTSLHRLCKVVRNHTVIEVQGAGSKHSGKYYVTGVKHTIDATSHNMDLELARNAWGNESVDTGGIISNIF